MESFGAEPFEIVERDDALSYWEFVHAPDAVDSDSDSDFGVASFDDGVSSLHSSVSESASLSLSDRQSLELTSPVESVDRDRDLRAVVSESLDRETLGAGRVLAPSLNVKLLHDEDLQSQSLGCAYGYDLRAVVPESLDHETLRVGLALVHDEGPRPQSQSIGYEFGWDYAYHRSNVCEDEYEEEEEEYDDDQDLDDELVPWSVNGKLGRQRMRKMGKRGYVKNSSKKAPHTNLKPGCLHGKHGLGVKHNF